MYLTPCDEECLYSPSVGPKSLMTINAHQVAVEKRLERHDEQLMLVISVVGRYNTYGYCDCWLRTKPSWVALHWALLDGPEEDIPQLLGF
ncbi:hypothetical protein QL285_038301 [Trifolium repens]|nr:hypothetical protein QL285_038301 [Trifolium repens]